MSKLILKIIFWIGSLLCLSLIILVSLNCIDNNVISTFINKYNLSFTVLAGFGIIMGVLFSYQRLSQQETVIDIQNRNLEELKSNNQLLKYKNHIEHYRDNLKYIESGYIEGVSIQTKSMAAYHRFYSSSKFGNFELNEDFNQLISDKIEFLVSLLTNHESKFERQNESLCRFVEICETAGSMLDCVGMKCDLCVRATDDDGRVFPFEVYEYVSTCFKVLMTLFDGELGKWTNMAAEFSNINYASTMDDAVCHDGKYCPEDLFLLTNVFNTK